MSCLSARLVSSRGTDLISNPCCSSSNRGQLVARQPRQSTRCGRESGSIDRYRPSFRQLTGKHMHADGRIQSTDQGNLGSRDLSHIYHASNLVFVVNPTVSLRRVCAREAPDRRDSLEG